MKTNTALSGMTRMKNRLWMSLFETKSRKRQRQLNQYWMNRLASPTPVVRTDDSSPSDLDH